ncbi:4'-phosphopantetheinyl transferase family protein [Halalkalibacter alkalisediminis]|uniref:4'-phosphopantetheinyl transferase superfamily protein n=1 Tax=Halalkalibacter alkalisediminis TaxID=935616 RepID=A0ABV6NL41_9BACI|nr:4'-phosphopantetheinyl transferase superfamily protein [Halalkalibacter alkalisediminis]
MIYGTGIDIVQHSSVEKMLKKGTFQPFIRKWFSEYELHLIKMASSQIKQFSVLFSIKEAFIKASNGIAKLKDTRKITILKYHDSYEIVGFYKEFLNDKTYSIDISQNDLYTISSICIFYREGSSYD